MACIHCPSLTLYDQPFQTQCIESPAIRSHKCVSYRLLSLPISYIVSPAINSRLCISYRLTKFPISVYRIVCHQFLCSVYRIAFLQVPSLCILLPAINTVSLYSIACYKFQSLYIASPVIISHFLYHNACHQFPTLFIVSTAIISHFFISYRLTSVPTSVLRIACH